MTATTSTSLPPKTPISYLQEICARRGITPKYDLMSIEGAVHEPTFVYRVTVADLTASGTGQSKKKAKHSAAKAVLDMLLSGQGGAPFVNIAASIANSHANTSNHDVNGVKSDDSTNGSGTPVVNGTSTGDLRSAPILSPYDDGIPGNPVGALQEACMGRRWPPPQYDVVDEEGLPHERTFTIRCLVKKLEEKGRGKSKKLAKRQAAHKMLQRIKEVPVENAAPMDEDDDDRFADLKGCKVQALNPSMSHKVSQFYKDMKANPGVKLQNLHATSLSDAKLNHVNLLQEIAHENNFDLTFVDIEETSKSGLCQCLVQLSTLPVAVCHGEGKTSHDAQANASKNALEYLKIMTRK